MKKEFISLAAYLENSSGHFYHYQLSLQKALKELVDFRLLLPRKTELASLPENWQPWFTTTKRKKGTLFDYLRIFSRTKKNRIIFLEYFQRRDFFRFTLAAFFRSTKKDTLWILYRDNFFLKRKKERLIINLCSRILKWRFSTRFIVLTDTDQLKNFYTSFFSQEVHLLPINHAPFHYPQKQKQNKILLSWLGPPRKEKGSDIIQKLFQLKDPFANQFILQFSKQLDFIPPSNGLEIKRLEKVMSPNSYTQALLDSDCILLPYDANRYMYSSSGIFVEAIAAGKIPLANANTWAAFELQKHDLNELILDWNEPLLYQTIYELSSTALIRNKLLKMQKAYISYHNPLTFKNCLLHLVK